MTALKTNQIKNCSRVSLWDSWVQGLLVKFMKWIAYSCEDIQEQDFELLWTPPVEKMTYACVTFYNIGKCFVHI